MIFRLADLADLNACQSLNHGSTTDHVWQMQVREAGTATSVGFQTIRLPRLTATHYPRDLDQLVEDWQRGEGFMVAELDGEIRGYVDVLARRWQQVGWVANMAVDEGYRRRGIATRLIEHARQWAWQQGMQGLVVEASTKNYPALRLYRKLGFRFCGFNDHYYPNQDIALFFVESFR